MGADDKKIFRISGVLPKLTKSLVRRDPLAAQELLDSLPLAQRVQAVLERRGKDRMDLILLSEKPQALVRLMPEQEVYQTIKEIGEEDALPIIQMTNVRQLTYILDIEVWHKERLDPLTAIRWIALLLECGPEKALQWIKNADEEFLVLLLSRFFRVFTVDPDDEGMEPWRSLSLFTLEDTHYVHIFDRNLAPYIEEFLQILRAEMGDYYYRLLDLVSVALPLELEDTAYMFRQARLADYGFVDFDEAFHIYRYLSRKQMKDLEENPQRKVKPARSAAPAPRFGLDLYEGGTFLAQALTRIKDEATMEKFRHDLVWLANRVMIADSMDLTNLDTVHKALQKVLHYLDMGLRIWSDDDPQRAARLLENQPLADIFRAGFSKILDVHRKTLRLIREGWPRQVEEGLALLEEPCPGIIQGALRKRPVYYVGGESKENTSFRDFQTLDEVLQAEHCIRDAEFLGTLFFEVLGMKMDDISELRQHSLETLTFKSAFLTAFIKGLVAGRFKFRPLSESELKQVRQKLFETNQKKIRPEIKKEFLEWVARRLENVPHMDRKKTGNWIQKAVKDLEDELGAIDLPDLDKRHIGLLVIKTG